MLIHCVCLNNNVIKKILNVPMNQYIPQRLSVRVFTQRVYQSDKLGVQLRVFSAEVKVNIMQFTERIYSSVKI